MYDAQIEMFLRIMLAVLQRLKWLLLLALYLGILAVFGFKGLLFLSFILAPSVLAYAMDKEREAQGQDDFTGSGLFYRYGEQIHDLTLSIPVQPEWDEQQTRDFAQSLQVKLAQRIRRYLPDRLAQIQDSLRLANMSTRETKDFIRVLARSRQGSLLAHFVHFGTYGSTITAHYFTFIRGFHTNFDVFRFIVEGPLTMWFWGIPWLLNRHSIMANLSRFRNDSYETLNLEDMVAMTGYVVTTETSSLLEEAGLLSPEVKQVIYNNLTSLTSLKIMRSSGVNIGSVLQSTTQTAAPLKATA